MAQTHTAYSASGKVCRRGDSSSVAKPEILLPGPSSAHDTRREPQGHLEVQGFRGNGCFSICGPASSTDMIGHRFGSLSELAAGSQSLFEDTFGASFKVLELATVTEPKSHQL